MSEHKSHIQESIDDLNFMKESHAQWAEYFEDNPNIEKEYVDSGEWDTAEEHRNLVSKYDKVLDILKNIKSIDHE